MIWDEHTEVNTTKFAAFRKTVCCVRESGIIVNTYLTRRVYCLSIVIWVAADKLNHIKKGVPGEGTPFV